MKPQLSSIVRTHRREWSEGHTLRISLSMWSKRGLGALGGAAPSATAMALAACTVCSGSFWKFSSVIV